MRTRKTKFVAGGVLVVALVLFASVLIGGGPAVSVTVVGYTTNQWPDDIAADLGQRMYVCAVVAVTNMSKQTLTYLAYPSKRAHCTILHQTAFGWEEPGSGFRCGNSGLKSCTLSPSQGFTFEAVVPTDKACKVAFDYSDGRTPSAVWDKLPYRIVRRVPWATPWRTVASEAIDLRATP